jgi:hypothetical protein
MLTIYEKYKLQNGYWLKIRYFLGKQSTEAHPVFLVDIVVAKTMRQCNDHYKKTKNSPKNLRNKSTNSKGGIEALRISLESILNFSERLRPGCIIHIEGSDDQRVRVYKRLTRYGFIEASHFSPGNEWHKREYFYYERI